MLSRARATRDSRVCRLQLGNKMMLFFSFLKGDRGGPGAMGQSGPEGGPVRLAYYRRSDSGDGAEKKQEGVGGGGVREGKERERERERERVKELSIPLLFLFLSPVFLFPPHSTI